MIISEYLRLSGSDQIVAIKSIEDFNKFINAVYIEINRTLRAVNNAWINQFITSTGLKAGVMPKIKGEIKEIRLPPSSKPKEREDEDVIY